MRSAQHVAVIRAGGQRAIDPLGAAIPVIDLAGVSKVFCADLWASSRYAINDLLNPLTVFRRRRSEQLRPGEFFALQDISFTLMPGEVLAVFGPHHSGKSTLANILGGFYPPDFGEARLCGRRVLANSLTAGMRPMLTLRENTHFRMALYGVRGEALAERVEEVLAFAGLAEAASRPLFNIDPLHIRRLGVAALLHIEGDILIFDDTLSMRDLGFRADSYDKLRTRLAGRTAMFITRKVDLAQALCTRGLVLDQGKQVFDGDVDLAWDLAVELAKRDRYQAVVAPELNALMQDIVSEDVEELDAELEKLPELAASEDNHIEEEEEQHPAFVLESSVVSGMRTDGTSSFWLLLRSGEEVDLYCRLRATREGPFDEINLNLNCPGELKPFAQSRLHVGDDFATIASGQFRCMEGDVIECRGRLSIPHLNKSFYGLSLLIGRKNVLPSRKDVIKLAIFGVLTEQGGTPGLVLDFAGTASRAAPDESSKLTREQSEDGP